MRNGRNHLKTLLTTLTIFLLLAAVVGAQGGTTNFDNVVTSGDLTVGGDLVVTGTTTATGALASNLVFEGSSADEYETTFAVTIQLLIVRSPSRTLPALWH